MSFLKHWGMLSAAFVAILLLVPGGEIGEVQFYAGLALCLLAAWICRKKSQTSDRTGGTSKAMIALTLMTAPGYAFYLWLSGPAAEQGEFSAVTGTADSVMIFGCLISLTALIFMIIYSVYIRVRNH